MAGLIHFQDPDEQNLTPVSAANPLPTALAGGSAGNPNANPSGPFTGQQTVSPSAAALPGQALVNGVAVQALSANTQTVYVGASGVTASTGYPLGPGQAISFAVANADSVYVLGQNATDVVAFAGS